MDEPTMSMFVNAGSAAVVAYAFLRGLRVAETVVNRLLDTVDRLCTDCEKNSQE